MALVIAGAFAFFLGRGITPERQDAEAGPPLSMEEQHLIPAWIGGLVALAGVALVLGHVRREA